MTDPPESITYSSVVSRETVRIAFMIAALNDLAICAADIGNSYLNAKCKVRIWVKASKEFRADEGKLMIIVKALYGLKSSVAAWRNLLSSSIIELGFTSLKADPDLYYRAQVKKDGEKYYEYLLVYVDDTLCLSDNMKPIMEEIGALYRLKEYSVDPPERYLDADTKILKMKSGIQCWTMSPDSYVREAISNVEVLIEQDGKKMRKAMTPFPKTHFKPELDTSPLLDASMMSRY